VCIHDSNRNLIDTYNYYTSHDSVADPGSDLRGGRAWTLSMRGGRKAVEG